MAKAVEVLRDGVLSEDEISTWGSIYGRKGRFLAIREQVAANIRKLRENQVYFIQMKEGESLKEIRAIQAAIMNELVRVAPNRVAVYYHLKNMIVVRTRRDKKDEK
jgi:hypothetical protein